MRLFRERLLARLIEKHAISQELATDGTSKRWTRWTGQLARELRLGSWGVAPADARSVFSSDPSALWPRVHGLMKRLEARATAPADPSYCTSLLLTNAIMRPSGDQDGTLIVPCPPYT